MLNSKETLKKLHKKFPTLSLDDLFEILDCYTEEHDVSKYIINTPLIHKNYLENTNDWRVTCTYPKNSVADQISNKLNHNITYNDNSSFTSRTSDYQLESQH